MNEFKLIVAGGRDFMDYTKLEEALTQVAFNVYPDKDVSIVSGRARGADAMGYHFAIENGVKAYSFPAKWKEHGQSAGFIRNSEMANFADGLLAFWDGKSRGTRHMIDTMLKMGKEVHIIEY